MPPLPAESVDRVLLEFQNVMQEFLGVQRQVFTAYFSAARPSTVQPASIAPWTQAAPQSREAPAGAFTSGAAQTPDTGDVVRESPAHAAAPAAHDGTTSAPVQTPREMQAAPTARTAATDRDDAPAAEAQPLLRLVVHAVDRPSPAGRRAGLGPGSAVVVTDDGGRVSTGVCERLQREGCRVALVRLTAGSAISHIESADSGPRVFESTLDSPDETQRLVREIVEGVGPIGAIVHLLPLAPGLPFEEMDLAAWTERLARDTRTLFLLARAAAESLDRSAQAGGAAVIAATSMGGAFGTGATPGHHAFFPGQGGVVGFTKCLAVEWPRVRAKAVDLDESDPAELLAAHVVRELWADDDEVEIGYSNGRRVGLEVIPAPAHSIKGEFAIPSDAVVLATGGARGITADVCLELGERYQPTFVLVGRTPLPDGLEAGDTAGLSAPADVKRALMTRLSREGRDVTVPMVEQAYRRLLHEREIRATLGALSATGSRVHYAALDVCDPVAFGALIDEIYTTYGRLDGIIHGAGVIEDKLVAQKPVDSFDRVFNTKTRSAFILSRCVRPDSLRFAVFFSSVAGRFGNRGQADYAAANEIVNKLVVDLKERWPGRVCAIDWAPWDKRGMVSPELKRQFQERQIELVDPTAGRRAFWAEIQQPHADPAEVVLASHRGSLALREPEKWPLLTRATRQATTPGVVQHARFLDPEFDRYLNDHRLDGRPVFPLAFATELMAEAAQATWPDLEVVAVRELRLLKGIIVDPVPVPLTVSVRVPVHAREDLVTEASVEIASPTLSPTLRYAGIVELAPRVPEAPSFTAPRRGLATLPMSLGEAYSKFTFHGPSFRRLTRVEGYDEAGIVGHLSSDSSETGIFGVARARWLLDPFAFDAAMHLVLMWSRLQNDKTALPTRFTAFRRYGALSDQPVTCYVGIDSRANGHSLVTEIHFVGPGGQVLGVLEGLEASCAASLNRLTGATEGR